MIGEECVLEFFQGLESRGQGKNSTLKAKTKDFKIVLEDPWGLVLEDSNTAKVPPHWNCRPGRLLPLCLLLLKMSYFYVWIAQNSILAAVPPQTLLEELTVLHQVPGSENGREREENGTEAELLCMLLQNVVTRLHILCTIEQKRLRLSGRWVMTDPSATTSWGLQWTQCARVKLAMEKEFE